MSLINSPFGASSTAQEVISGHDLSDKTVIVTGGASGIGVETARVLAKAGAEVVIAARSPSQAEAATEAVNIAAHGRASWRVLDLASFKSIRDFAAEWKNRPLHLLINNAGVMACPLGYTEDDLEMQIGTNHFGHYLLSGLLTPALESGAEHSSAPSRLVALSSTAHRMSDINFEDPHFRKRPYDPWVSYGQSKTANILFALEYDRRHKNKGIRSLSVMPGRILTPLMRHMSDGDKQAKGLLDKEGKPNPRMQMKTVEQGAATSVWAAVGNELNDTGGIYLEDCAQCPMRSDAAPFGLEAYANDPESAERLWSLSMKTAGI